jgi:hypothetical protein
VNATIRNHALVAIEPTKMSRRNKKNRPTSAENPTMKYSVPTKTEDSNKARGIAHQQERAAGYMFAAACRYTTGRIAIMDAISALPLKPAHLIVF